jgi:hypothetical protein
VKAALGHEEVVVALFIKNFDRLERYAFLGKRCGAVSPPCRFPSGGFAQRGGDTAPYLSESKIIHESTEALRNPDAIKALWLGL